MHLTLTQRHAIRQTVEQFTHGRGLAWLYGPCACAHATCDDIELLVDCPDPVDDPGQLENTLLAHLSAALGPRRVNVLLQAPNLPDRPAHCVARATGQLL
jgi:hypothetical protein